MISNTLYLPLTYPDYHFPYPPFKNNTQNFTNIPKVYICRNWLLNLPNTYAELYYYTYSIHMQTFATKPTEYIRRTLLLYLQ